MAPSLTPSPASSWPSAFPSQSLQSRDIEGVPLSGGLMSVLLSLTSITILTLFITQRSIAIKVWSKLPYVVWLVFAIYVDSYLFVFVTAILQLAFGLNSSVGLCQGGILLCLVCYVTTKVFIYLFLVEKAHIIRGTKKHRLKSRLYLVNSFGMMGIYIVVGILNFVYRIYRLQNGQCFIGMKSIAMIPLISFDAVVNIYLTFLFMIPLKNLYTFKNRQRTPANIRLRTIAIRTFIGAISTLISSIVNLTVLMSLNGEPGWVCLICCNCDILFSSVVIQWITNKDNAGSAGSTSRRDGTVDDRHNFDTKSGFALDSVAVHGGEGGATLASSARSHGNLGGAGRPSADSESSCDVGCADDSTATDGDERPIRPTAPPHAVVVTTTIRRESKPSANPQSDHSVTTVGFLGSVTTAAAQVPRTRITAGSNNS